MQSAEFDSLSPQDLGDLLIVAEEKTKEADYRAGIIVSVMANIHAGKDAEPYVPGDFFPRLRANQPQATGPEPTDDEVFAKIEAALFRS